MDFKSKPTSRLWAQLLAIACVLVIVAIPFGVKFANSRADVIDDCNVQMKNIEELEKLNTQLLNSEQADLKLDFTEQFVTSNVAGDQLDGADEQIEQGRKDLAEGEKKYQDGKNEYDSQYSKYQSGLKEYEEGLSKYTTGSKEYETGLAKYKEALAEYEQGKKDYEAGLQKYQAGQQEYNDSLQQYNSSKALVDTLEPVYNLINSNYYAMYNYYKRELQKAEEGSDYQKELQQKIAPLEQFFQTEVLGFGTVEEIGEKFRSGKLELTRAEKQLKAAEKELAVAKKELSAAENKLASGQVQLEESKAILDAAKSELDSGKKELDSGKKELDSGKKQLDSGKKKLDAAESEINDSRKKLEEASAQVDDGKKAKKDSDKKLNEDLQKLDDLTASGKKIESGKKHYLAVKDIKDALPKDATTADIFDTAFNYYKDTAEKAEKSQASFVPVLIVAIIAVICGILAAIFTIINKNRFALLASVLSVIWSGLSIAIQIIYFLMPLLIAATIAAFILSAICVLYNKKGK